MSSLYPLTNLAEGFIHVVLDIENLYQLASLSFEDFSMANESTFYNPSTGQYIGFDKIAVSEPIYPFLAPHIDMIAPNPIPAGTGDILTITGNQFGNFDPLTCTQCRVRFPNGDQTAGQDWVYAFGKDIVTWTDTEITLKVPSATEGGVNKPAMSGKIRVERPGNGGNVETSNQVDIHIPYSVLNNRTSSAHLSSIFRLALWRQTADGIRYEYDEDVPVNLRNIFKNSVDLWCARTNIAWNIAANDIVISTENGSDGINSVVMMPGSTFSSQAALAAVVITGHFTQCGGGGNFTFYLNDVDMKVNEDAYDPFEANWQQKWSNAMLHELGHAHLLNHSKNPSIPSAEEYLMIADQGPFGSVFMPIQDDDATGANTVFASSAVLLGIAGCEGIDPIIPHPTGNCGGIDAVGEEVVNASILSVSPSPFLGHALNLEFYSKNQGEFDVTIFNQFGEIFYREKGLQVASGENSIQLTNVEIDVSGIYFISLSNGVIILTSKIIKL